MSDKMQRALQNAAASSAMEGQPLSQAELDTVEQLLSGTLTLTDFFEQLHRQED